MVPTTATRVAGSDLDGQHEVEKSGDDHVGRIRGLIRLLAKLDKTDRQRIGLARLGGYYLRSGAIYRTATTYEDVFALCQYINDWMHGLSDNALATPLVELIERDGGRIVDGKGRSAHCRHRPAGAFGYSLHSNGRR